MNFDDLIVEKGARIDLETEKAVSKMTVGLGWDTLGGKDVDLDASLLMLKGGKLTDSKDVIYFGRTDSQCGGIHHTGDNLTGAGDGDDEQIQIDFSKIPADYNKLVVLINSFNAKRTGINFGLLENAEARVFEGIAKHDATNEELGEKVKARILLGFDHSESTAVVIGVFEKHPSSGHWTFVNKTSEFGTIADGLGEIKPIAESYQ